jgi:crotonobetainyl-CoA:carnitine CoA-transferase CaiB-like acyl-CoA transferase
VEALLVEAGAAAAVNRTVEEWLAHPAGAAVHAEPMVHFDYADALVQSSWAPTPGRPLAGIRVLDMTRVIAGPTGTRFLAALGAEVLRLDEPGSDESSGQMGQGNEFMVGKRWALLDIRTPEGKQRFLDLLARTDILIHGYRPGGIDALVSQAERFQAKPDLIEVAYRAYGWTGPWAMRRGFDTIVQWSTGICNANQAWGLERPDRRLPLTAIGRKLDASRPRHMPVEALDFGTAYQIAAAALRGLTRRVQTGRGSVSRLSLARTASILLNQERAPDAAEIELPLEGPWEDRVYVGAKGPAKRLQFPVTIQGNPLFWERPTEPAGASSPVWAS